MDIPELFDVIKQVQNRRTHGTNVTPPILLDGETFWELSGQTKLWIGSTAGNRLLVSSIADDDAIGTRGYMKLSGGNIGPISSVAIHTNNFRATYSQGAHLNWNRGGGDGSTWLVNQRGGGPGGFHFGEIESDGTGYNERFAIDGAGTIRSFGRHLMNFDPIFDNEVVTKNYADTIIDRAGGPFLASSGTPAQRTMNNGIRWNQGLVGDPPNVASYLDLFGGTYGLGISGGTLNVATGGVIEFYINQVPIFHMGGSIISRRSFFSDGAIATNGIGVMYAGDGNTVNGIALRPHVATSDFADIAVNATIKDDVTLRLVAKGDGTIHHQHRATVAVAYQTPIFSYELAAKAYVDTFMPRTGGIFTGDITATSIRYARDGQPGVSGNLIGLQWDNGFIQASVDRTGNPGALGHVSWINSNFLPLVGGNLTGHLGLVGAPTQTLHAVNKGYIDDLVGQIAGIAQKVIGKIDGSTGDCQFLPISGFPDGPLPPASPGIPPNGTTNCYVICDVPGTVLDGEIAGETLEIGDWVASDGNGWIVLGFGASAYLPITGGNLLGGISFNNAVGDAPSDLSRHLNLWGGTYGVGVSSNRLNVKASTGPTSVNLMIGDVDILTASGTNVTAYRNIRAPHISYIKPGTSDYSNAIGFDWDGKIQAYIDSVNQGTLATEQWTINHVNSLGPFLPLTGGTLSGGLAWQAPSYAIAADDVTRHINLWVGAAGICIFNEPTFSMNYLSGSRHGFRIGAAGSSNEIFTVTAAGVIITGSTTLGTEPTAINHAATRGYVDSRIPTGGPFLPIAGGTIDGQLTVTGGGGNSPAIFVGGNMNNIAPSSAFSMAIGFNYTGGSGEADFFNQYTTGTVNGFAFHQLLPAGPPLRLLWMQRDGIHTYRQLFAHDSLTVENTARFVNNVNVEGTTRTENISSNNVEARNVLSVISGAQTWNWRIIAGSTWEEQVGANLLNRYSSLTAIREWRSGVNGNFLQMSLDGDGNLKTAGLLFALGSFTDQFYLGEFGTAFDWRGINFDNNLWFGVHFSSGLWTWNNPVGTRMSLDNNGNLAVAGVIRAGTGSGMTMGWVEGRGANINWINEQWFDYMDAATGSRICWSPALPGEGGGAASVLDALGNLWIAGTISTAHALRGGPGNAGTLLVWNGGSAVNFRWDGATLFYRVDESVDRPIATTLEVETLRETIDELRERITTLERTIH